MTSVSRRCDSGWRCSGPGIWPKVPKSGNPSARLCAMRTTWHPRPYMVAKFSTNRERTYTTRHKRNWPSYKISVGMAYSRFSARAAEGLWRSGAGRVNPKCSQARCLTDVEFSVSRGRRDQRLHSHWIAGGIANGSNGFPSTPEYNWCPVMGLSKGANKVVTGQGLEAIHRVSDARLLMFAKGGVNWMLLALARGSIVILRGIPCHDDMRLSRRGLV